jgi:N-acetylmuramoyl-L-alanine amidase
LSRNTYEKDITLTIGKLIEDRLSKIRAIKVLLTRSKDTDMAIKKRTETAQKAKADLFVSIHINAGFGNASSGYEIYFSGFKQPSSTKESSNEIVKDMVRNQYLNDSVRFAQIFQKNFSRVFPREDRGLRDAPFLVCEGLTIPSVVIELGFATNIENKKKLRNKETQKSIANAIAKSIREYFAGAGV